MDFLRQYKFPRTGLILSVVLTMAAASAIGQTSAPASRAASEPAAAAKTHAVPDMVGRRDAKLVSKGDTAGMWRGLFQTLGALAVVGGIMIALWLGLRRVRRQTGTGGGEGSLAVLGRTSLSSRHHIYVVRWAGRLLLVGTGPQGISVLSDTPVSPAVSNAPQDREGQVST